MTRWQRNNKRQILQRLVWMQSKPDGIIIHHQDSEEEIMVVKEDNLALLHFIGQDAKTGKDVISDVMSVIDIHAPLMLHSPYTQTMMMSLAFAPNPKRLYMLGFGGGRIPMILHHHLPNLCIEASELSSGVLSILEMCFGIKTDARMQISQVNGRAHLQAYTESWFDIILLDSFSGAGVHPNELSTMEFYQLCKSRLTHTGVVATNLVDNNRYFRQKKETFCASFNYSYCYRHEENHVYIGSDHLDIDTNELALRASEVDSQYQFDFKLVDYAKHFVQQYHRDQPFLLTDS